MDPAAAFDRAIRIAGSQCKLAAATGYSQVAINKARRRGAVSPVMALAVHRFTGGAVPASALAARSVDPAAGRPAAGRARSHGTRPDGSCAMRARPHNHFELVRRAVPSPAQRRTGAAPGLCGSVSRAAFFSRSRP
jgi:DNA-binding transcriptional regulator YdaS (Cro superfamily)